MISRRFVEQNAGELVPLFAIENYCQAHASDIRMLSVLTLEKAREILGENFHTNYYEDILVTRQLAGELFTAIDEIYSKRDAEIAEEEYEGLRQLAERESEAPNV